MSIGVSRTRSRWALPSILVAVAIAAGVDSAPAQNLDDVEIRATHVAGNVHMLEGAGGNIGVSVGSDGILLIDDQFAPLAEKIRAAVKNIDKGKIEFVLNTHWHGDHTGGNPFFGREAKILAHSNVRRRLSGEKPTAGRPVANVDPKGLPVLTYEQGITLHFNGEEVRVVHVPRGHTDGDSIIFFERSKVLHMGDQFTNGRFPFVDMASGGTLDGYIANVTKVLETVPDDWKIIPGHGPLGTKADLKRFKEMIETTVAWVRERIDGGKSVEEIVAEGLPEKWKSWGEGFVSEERWIQTIHQSLTTASEKKDADA